jgi:hypothetical protein
MLIISLSGVIAFAQFTSNVKALQSIYEPCSIICVRYFLSIALFFRYRLFFYALIYLQDLLLKQ